MPKDAISEERHKLSNTKIGPDEKAAVFCNTIGAKRT
jgi:hypothetical protein